MGTMWTVWPLDDQMKEWLGSQGIAIPTSSSRFPTGAEIKQTVSDAGVEAEINDNGLGGTWQAFLGDEREWANLLIREYTADEEPQELYFEKGHESLIRKILQLLTPACGPLVLINDAGDPPEVITA